MQLWNLDWIQQLIRIFYPMQAQYVLAVIVKAMIYHANEEIDASPKCVSFFINLR
jgi:hypothetical protein